MKCSALFCQISEQLLFELIYVGGARIEIHQARSNQDNQKDLFEFQYAPANIPRRINEDRFEILLTQEQFESQLKDYAYR